MTKEIKITVVTPQEQEYDFDNNAEWKPPANHYIVDAMGNSVFIHVRSRAEAQKWADENYGKGRYLVRAAKISKGSGEITCSGSNSRKGFAPQLRKTV